MFVRNSIEAHATIGKDIEAGQVKVFFIIIITTPDIDGAGELSVSARQR
jgi:hypothetical protein